VTRVATTSGSLLRRHRAALSIGMLVVVTIAALSLVTATSGRRTDALDPRNPSPVGARAVARVLVDRGVQVTVVRRAAELERTAVDRDTTVMVTGSQNLGRSSARRLEQHSTDAGALVLPVPAPTLTRVLGLPVVADDRRAAGRASARCADPLLSGLVLDVPPSSVYRARAAGAVSCFPGPQPGSAGWVVRVGGAGTAGTAGTAGSLDGAEGPVGGEGSAGRDRRPATYVVGAAAVFTNQHVRAGDNAAVALRLLGQRDRLVWYVPDLRDVAVGDTGSLAAQLPGGLVPALWLIAASVLATMLWRGRRLGPLVVEPLPVVVKAVESTRGRGRLYRKVRDRGHAGAILRSASSNRLAARLRLPADTDVGRLAAAVAEATGANPRAVHDVLVTRPVPDDRALTRLAADLAALEREVQQR
jgi:hypothetical protein